MAHLSWAEVRLCEELCPGDVRTLSPAQRPSPAPSHHRGQLSAGKVTVRGWGLAQTPSHSFPLILALGACPWGRGSIRAVTYSAATCLLVPGTCPRQSLEQRDASNGFQPGCSSESPGPTPEILI